MSAVNPGLDHEAGRVALDNVRLARELEAKRAVLDVERKHNAERARMAHHLSRSIEINRRAVAIARSQG